MKQKKALINWSPFLNSWHKLFSLYHTTQYLININKLYLSFLFSAKVHLLSLVYIRTHTQVYLL